jgi:hypothetical protein
MKTRTRLQITALHPQGQGVDSAPGQNAGKVAVVPAAPAEHRTGSEERHKASRPLLLLTPSDASKIFCGQHEKQISPPRRLLMRSAVLGHEQVKHSLSATARICATCAAAPHEKSTSILSQTDTTRLPRWSNNRAARNTFFHLLKHLSLPLPTWRPGFFV